MLRLDEAQRADGTNDGQLVTELADLYEVMDTLMAAVGIDHEIVIRVQAQRREEHGGFWKRIRLIWSE